MAQSTSTLAESRPPYIHLGYVSASCRSGLRSLNSDIFVPGTFLFLLGCLIALKLNYGWLIGGVGGLFRKLGPLKVLATLASIALICGAIVLYCVVSVFN